MLNSFTPPGLKDYQPPAGLGYDPVQARALLAAAGFPGGKGFPRLSILYNSSEQNEQIATEIQAIWKENLGIEVGLRKQEWKVYLNSLTSLDYDIGRSSWVGDYRDPVTFLDCMTTGNGNNRTGWSSKDYDALLDQARREPDPARRLGLLRAAETILVERELPVLPIYGYVGISIYDPAKLAASPRRSWTTTASATCIRSGRGRRDPVPPPPRRGLARGDGGGDDADVLPRPAPSRQPVHEGAGAAEATIRQLEAQYHLNGTPLRQFADYAGGIAHGSLGPSISYRNRTVNEILGQALPVSLVVGGAAFVLAIVLGVWLGAYAAVHHGRPGDRLAMLAALLGISVPVFVAAPLLILVFGVALEWLPVAGWGGPRELVLPAFCLGLPFAASVARLMRTSLLDVMRQDFVRTARAKGLSEMKVVYRHALKVAILPVVSYAGPLAANLLTGSLVVEQIFAIPGIGPFFVNSVLNKDSFMVGGIVLVYTVLLVSFNIAVDVAYAFLDKRIRLE